MLALLRFKGLSWKIRVLNPNYCISNSWNYGFLQYLAPSRVKKDLICFEFWVPSRERLSLLQFLVFIKMLSLWLSTCKNLWSKFEQNKHQIILEYICSTLLTTHPPLQHWNKLMSRRRVPRNHFCTPSLRYWCSKWSLLSWDGNFRCHTNQKEGTVSNCWAHIFNHSYSVSNFDPFLNKDCLM